jgi:hypothetical protein
MTGRQTRLGAGGALAALALAVAGCGADPVREDLLLYDRVVLERVKEVEQLTSTELEPLMYKMAEGRLEPREAHALYRGELVDRYRALVAHLEAHRPATPELASLHARLTVQYRQTVKKLEDCADGLSKAEWKKVDAAHEALTKLGYVSIRADLTALAAKHRIDVASH